MIANWWKFIKKNLSELWSCTFFFHDFILYIAQQQINPGIDFLCQIKTFITIANWCSFIKIILNCDLWFYIHFFLDFYMYIGKKQEQILPGTDFNVKWNILSLGPNSVSLKKSLWPVFYTYFFQWGQILHCHKIDQGWAGWSASSLGPHVIL